MTPEDELALTKLTMMGFELHHFKHGTGNWRLDGGDRDAIAAIDRAIHNSYGVYGSAPLHRLLREVERYYGIPVAQ